jgi:hypothetical protein
MTNKEILEKAKKDYPIGTIYNGLEGDGSEDGTEYNLVAKFEARWTTVGERIEVGRRFIYANHKWATIVSKPVPAESLLTTIL